jgi:hypothetical protein
MHAVKFLLISCAKTNTMHENACFSSEASSALSPFWSNTSKISRMLPNTCAHRAENQTFYFGESTGLYDAKPDLKKAVQSAAWWRRGQVTLRAGAGSLQTRSWVRVPECLQVHESVSGCIQFRTWYHPRNSPPYPLPWLILAGLAPNFALLHVFVSIANALCLPDSPHNLQKALSHIQELFRARVGLVQFACMGRIYSSCLTAAVEGRALS